MSSLTSTSSFPHLPSLRRGTPSSLHSGFVFASCAIFFQLRRPAARFQIMTTGMSNMDGYANLHMAWRVAISFLETYSTAK